MTDEQFLKKLGKKVAQLREGKGISQRELARKIQTSNTQIIRIEYGKVNPSINILRRIAAVFDIDVSELVKIKQ